MHDRLPQGVEVAAYYVVSEAMANAAKHAHASALDVDVAVDGDDLQRPGPGLAALALCLALVSTGIVHGGPELVLVRH